MDRILYLLILIGLGIFFIYKMFNPPTSYKYNLKTIIFLSDNNMLTKTDTLGFHIFTVKGKRKFILPSEFDLWKEIHLFENGIILKKNKKEMKLFFYEMYAIKPVLVNSFFVKGKYFAYIIELRNSRKVILKSNEINNLDLFMEKLFSLLSEEKGMNTIIE